MSAPTALHGSASGDIALGWRCLDAVIWLWHRLRIRALRPYAGYVLVLFSFLLVGLLAIGVALLAWESIHEFDPVMVELLGFSWENYELVLSEPYYFRTFARTLGISIVVTLVSIALALPLAYTMVRTRSRLARFTLLCIAFLPFLVASPIMFLLGASFAFYIVIPLAFDFFLGFQQFAPTGEDISADAFAAEAGITFQGSVAEYLSLTIKFILAFGLCFQLPVLLTLMGKAGLVSAEGLGQFRKYAVVGILTLAAVVTPPDVITQVILFVVVYGLYEISIWLVRRVERRREKRLREQGLDFDDDDESSANESGSLDLPDGEKTR